MSNLNQENNSSKNILKNTQINIQENAFENDKCEKIPLEDIGNMMHTIIYHLKCYTGYHITTSYYPTIHNHESLLKIYDMVMSSLHYIVNSENYGWGNSKNKTYKQVIDTAFKKQFVDNNKTIEGKINYKIFKTKIEVLINNDIADDAIECFYIGHLVIDHDKNLAKSFFKKGMKKGDVSCMRCLANIYARQEKTNKALKLFHQCIELDDTESMIDLDEYIYSCDKNEYPYLEMALKLGNSDAAYWLSDRSEDAEKSDYYEEQADLLNGRIKDESISEVFSYDHKQINTNINNTNINDAKFIYYLIDNSARNAHKINP